MSDHPLYASFAEVLELSQPIKDDLEALLHPSTGFAPRLRQICANQSVMLVVLNMTCY
jgi:nuclear pore complex protein Nup107